MLSIDQVKFLLITIFNFAFVHSEEILEGLFIIHRHGDRTPVELYPNDPFKSDRNWPDGLGQLTLAGKRRMFSIGKYIRKRYGTDKKLLTDNPHEAYIRSAASDRCLESASLLLASIYPPKGHWVWNSDLNWQPIPIQTEPRSIDGILEPNSNCPNAERESNRIRNSVQVKKFSEKYKEFFEYLSFNSGNNITNLWEAEEIYDTLKCESEQNFPQPLPAWANNEVMDKLRIISSMTFYFDYCTKRIQKLRAGLLIKEIRNKMLEISHNSLMEKEKKSLRRPDPIGVPKKFFVYSSHDTMVAAFLSALGSFNNISPPYGASIILELLKMNTSDHFISAYFYNETEAQKPYRLKFFGCDEICSLKQFLSITEPMILDNWSSECGLGDQESNGSLPVLLPYLLAISLSSTFAFAFIVLTFLYIRRRREFNYKRLPIVETGIGDKSN